MHVFGGKCGRNLGVVAMHEYDRFLQEIKGEHLLNSQDMLKMQTSSEFWNELRHEDTAYYGDWCGMDVSDLNPQGMVWCTNWFVCCFEQQIKTIFI